MFHLYSARMTRRANKRPDLTLLLNADGVIQEAIGGGAFSDERLDDWVGQPWESTVDDACPGKVRSLLKTTENERVGGFSQIGQRLPSGKEVLMEFSAVQTAVDSPGFVAVGRNLGVVVEQQQKLLAAQHAMVANFWKARDLEARYRAMVASTSEAVVLVAKESLTIVESNALARDLLRLPDAAERKVVLDLGADTDRVANILAETQPGGKTPSTLVRLAGQEKALRVKATAIRGMQEDVILLHFQPTSRLSGIAGAAAHQASARTLQGIVIADEEGRVRMFSKSIGALAAAAGIPAMIGEPLEACFEDLDTQDIHQADGDRVLELSMISTSFGSIPVKACIHPLSADGRDGFALTIESTGRIAKVH